MWDNKEIDHPTFVAESWEEIRKLILKFKDKLKVKFKLKVKPKFECKFACKNQF